MTTKICIRPHDFKIARDILNEVLPASGSQIFVFGSRATGTLKRASDLDLAIDLGRPLTQLEQSNLAEKFEESDLPYRVDVVDLQTVQPYFKVIVEKTMRPFAIVTGE